MTIRGRGGARHQRQHKRKQKAHGVRHRAITTERQTPTMRCPFMIRKLASGKYRLYSRKKDPRTGKRRNLGTFDTRKAAQKHEREVQYFKRH
jgi:hypothetical protein